MKYCIVWHRGTGFSVVNGYETLSMASNNPTPHSKRLKPWGRHENFLAQTEPV